MTSSNRLIVLTLAAGMSLALVGCENGNTATPDHDTDKAMISHSDSQNAPAGTGYDKPGFYTRIEDGRLWVFRAGDQALKYIQGDLPADHVTRISAGPDGKTVKAVDSEIIDEYLLSKPGFIVRIEDGRMWVFRAASEAWQSYLANGAPADHVTRVSAGPDGRTIKAVDAETIDAYMLAKPGFEVSLVDGRIWVFPAGSEEAETFQATGNLPADHVTRVSAGPGGRTVKADESATIDAYLYSTDAYVAKVVDGRIWVFPAGSEELETFEQTGNLPADHVTRVSAGPDGKTVKALESATIDLYLAAVAE